MPPHDSHHLLAEGDKRARRPARAHDAVIGGEVLAVLGLHSAELTQRAGLQQLADDVDASCTGGPQIPHRPTGKPTDDVRSSWERTSGETRWCWHTAIRSLGSAPRPPAGMPAHKVRSVLCTDDPEIVRRHLEFHRERLEERLVDERGASTGWSGSSSELEHDASRPPPSHVDPIPARDVREGPGHCTGAIGGHDRRCVRHLGERRQPLQQRGAARLGQELLG